MATAETVGQGLGRQLQAVIAPYLNQPYSIIVHCYRCGPGSNDGIISKDMPFDTDGSAAALRSNAPRRPADKLRNMYTSAPKKGGYGMPWRDMSLGEPPKYYMDVYEGGREREKVRQRASTATAASVSTAGHQQLACPAHFISLTCRNALRCS
eukprot:GHRQ01034402.1.p1 GENE.GHRQ01034402.1~~GHRQ01034402.1.p1  ORF type:complete len:153 (-),score=50.41 GHRQ01034402.1:18-476(-)